MSAPAATTWSSVRTERLLLRRPEPADVDRFVALQVDPRAILHHPHPESVNPRAARAYFERSVQHWDDHGFGVWAVAAQHEPALQIGIAGVTHREFHGRPGLNLHYRFAPESWGRGFATEAARASVDLARRNLPGIPIVAFTTPGNVGSQHTAVAAGLERHTELDEQHSDHVDVYFTLGW